MISRSKKRMRMWVSGRIAEAIRSLKKKAVRDIEQKIYEKEMR